MNRCKPLSSIGNSDHDIVLLDTSIWGRRPKPARRKIYLRKKCRHQWYPGELDTFCSWLQRQPVCFCELDVGFIQWSNPQDYGKKSPKQDDCGTPYPPMDEWTNKKTDQAENASTQESKNNMHKTGHGQIQTTLAWRPIPDKISL